MFHFPSQRKSPLVGRASLLCGLIPWLVMNAAAADSDLSNPKSFLPFPGGKFGLEDGDLVAFVGGSDVVTAQQSGHLEALLAAKYRGVHIRFRNFGWEGDTVFLQPRDVGFPPLATHLERAHASVIVIQFGRTECFEGREALPRFVTAYEGLLNVCARQTPRLVLVTPPPLEAAGGFLPDDSRRNADLAAYANAIRKTAQGRRLPLVDLFHEFDGPSHHDPRLTDNGLQLTSRGHAFIARAAARQLGFGDLADRAGEPAPDGAWPNLAFEELRQAVIAKNRLWFNYWRPQNWAFLGGDRTTQPSSHDHRDPNIRWFPQEMEKFVPLIEEKEREVATLAARLNL